MSVIDASGSATRGIAFLCVANSARSQMAEGWARHYAPRGVEVFSAGSRPSGLNPLAVEVMREIGIDISSQRSKSVDELPLGQISTVVTLCEDEVCPVLPIHVQRLHWPFPDPADTELQASSDAALARFREVRDHIGERLRDYFDRG